MQRETPPAMLGRVSSAFMSLLSLAQVLGLILSGYLAQSLGIRNLFKASAVLLLVLAVFGYFRVREA
jgi:MFS family permease